MPENEDGNGKDKKANFRVVKLDEGEIRELSTAQQIDELCKWLQGNKTLLKGICICYEFQPVGDNEALGMQTTKMQFRDVQYILLDSMLRLWTTTRGDKP